MLRACRVQGSSTYRPELEPAQQSSAFAALPPEQQQALEQENQALVSELSSLNQASRSPSPPDSRGRFPCIELSIPSVITLSAFSLVPCLSTDSKKDQAFLACPQRRCRFSKLLLASGPACLFMLPESRC